MELSSTFCRAEEINQRDRAANAILENIRVIAAWATTAWGVEALSAERREARRARASLQTWPLCKLIGYPAKKTGCSAKNPDREFENP